MHALYNLVFHNDRYSASSSLETSYIEGAPTMTKRYSSTDVDGLLRATITYARLYRFPFF